MIKNEFQPTGWRQFEEIVRKASKAFGFSGKEKTLMLRDAHAADNFIADTSLAMRVGGQGLDGIRIKLDWLIDIIKDPEVKDEWQRLYWEECQKPEHKDGLNAFEDWHLREVAFQTIQERRKGSG